MHLHLQVYAQHKGIPAKFGGRAVNAPSQVCGEGQTPSHGASSEGRLLLGDELFLTRPDTADEVISSHPAAGPLSQGSPDALLKQQAVSKRVTSKER